MAKPLRPAPAPSVLRLLRQNVESKDALCGAFAANIKLAVCLANRIIGGKYEEHHAEELFSLWAVSKDRFSESLR